MQKIAFVADPHFHDITHRPLRPEAPTAAIRTLADTVASTRVFNESYPATRAALDDIVARGIRLVVIAGDLTDDGQAHATKAVAALLNEYSARHGLRFFATPGNHDLYAMHGRHQSKRFLNADGTHTLATSDATAAAGDSVERIASAEMYCGGYAATLAALAPFGFFRDPRDLHWESPFGGDDRLAARTFDIRSADGATVRRMIDASYLVEPEPGLWLLSIDADVFEPRDGGGDPAAEGSYIDSTEAGWNFVARDKPFLLPWMRDVAQRAAAKGKHLLAFSHYPAVDPMADTSPLERQMGGDSDFLARLPARSVASAVADTGIRVHFSGHLHLNSTARHRDGAAFLINVAIPSLVAFPAAYKIVSPGTGRLDVQTVSLDEVPQFDVAFGLYRAELARAPGSDSLLPRAKSYGEFLNRHLAELVVRRHLAREWPADFAALAMDLSLGDLQRIGATALPLTIAEARAGATPAARDGDSCMDLVQDWYRLRKGRDLARRGIDATRLSTYRALAALFAAGSWPAESAQARIGALLQIMAGYLDDLPSQDLSINLGDGTIRDSNAERPADTVRTPSGGGRDR
jgi:3',5'-cyclic AMP phosphodiesterase CpdA